MTVSYNPPFSHIYAEKGILNHPRTRQILAHFPYAKVVPIAHYKDVFNRPRQDISLQEKAKSLILAAQTGSLLFPGAPVCQSFGEEYFYYSSCILGCFFNCEYCFLKGMYPSAYPVIFVNLEDYFRAIEDLLKEHPVYLCVSYDTDLLAAEALTGYVREWAAFTAVHPGLRIEIRTKSAPAGLWQDYPPHPDVIFAFTLSPQAVIEQFEHGTPSLEKRLESAAAALAAGHPVRLCFDPILYFPDWEKHYADMAALVREKIPLPLIRDISIGSFRISQDFLKKMRRAMPDSPVVQFPYVNEDGYYSYGKELSGRLENFVEKQFTDLLAPERIFRWR